MAIAYPTPKPGPRRKPRYVPAPRPKPKRTSPARPMGPTRPGPTPMPRYPLPAPPQPHPPAPSPFKTPFKMPRIGRFLRPIPWVGPLYGIIEMIPWSPGHHTPGHPYPWIDFPEGWVYCGKPAPVYSCQEINFRYWTGGAPGCDLIEPDGIPLQTSGSSRTWYKNDGTYGAGPTSVPAGVIAVTVGQYQPAVNCGRVHIGEKWQRPDPYDPPVHGPLPILPPSPPVVIPPLILPPEYVPPWVPWLDPWQLPIGKPVPTPVPPPLPLQHPKPGEAPAGIPARSPLPRPIPNGVPSLDIDTGAGPRLAPAPGNHEYRPPDEGEKEKKGAPKAGRYTRAIMEAMDGLINTITETDDFVAAIYKALPWNVRRWKGRDGVWRDRDITTDARARRIYSELGSLSVTEMVKNLAANYAVDRIGGVIGELGKRAINANQYYRGVQGLQSGQRFTSDAWDDALHQLRLGAAAGKQPRDYYRWRYVHPDGNIFWADPDEDGVMTREGYVPSPYWKLPPGGRWERTLVKGRKQVIPWLQYTYNRRITKPRRGTAEWWRKQTNGVAFRPTAAYRYYAQ